MNILKPHVSLNVASVEASVAFSATLFGAEVKNQRPGHASFDLNAPSIFLVLDEKPPRHPLFERRAFRQGVFLVPFGVHRS